MSTDATYIRSSMRLPVILTALIACAWASPALADPCEGTLPSKGTTFSGVVRYVGDGDGF
jgi:micrococcal nuclease